MRAYKQVANERAPGSDQVQRPVGARDTLYVLPRKSKKGHVGVDAPESGPDNYVRFINRTQKSRFHGFIGSVKSRQSLAADFGRSFLKGQAATAALFSPG